MVVIQGQQEKDDFVHVPKIVTWGEKLINCWSCHKNPGLQQTLGFPDGTVGIHLPAMKEIQVQSLIQEDSPGGGHGNPLQYS